MYRVGREANCRDLPAVCPAARTGLPGSADGMHVEQGAGADERRGGGGGVVAGGTQRQRGGAPRQLFALMCV